MTRNKAIYDVTTTYGMHRKMIFRESREPNTHTYISVTNTRTGEYIEFDCRYQTSRDFLAICEIWIKEYFKQHLVHYKLVEFKGEI